MFTRNKSKPVIGIAMQTLPAKPGVRPDCWIIGQRYIDAMRMVGVVPWLVPLVPEDPDTMREICSRLDGIFLTGGVDVDPSRYGEERHPLCGTTDSDRDAVEMFLLREAMERDLPVLAICRGLQILNVTCGGTLYQDVTAQVPAALKHDNFPEPNNTYCRHYLAHDISVTRASRLGHLLGDSVVPVNSMHHQAIKDLAPNLTPTAFAPDGIIEGVEGTRERFMVAVQWHPEELTDTQPGMARLFTEFADAAA